MRRGEAGSAGTAWPVLASQGLVGPVTAGHGKARRVEAGFVGPGKVRLGKSRWVSAGCVVLRQARRVWSTHGMSRRCAVSHSRQGPARPILARRGSHGTARLNSA